MKYNDKNYSVYNGNKLKVKVFGSSHSKEIGVVVKGFNKGDKVNLDTIQAFLERRRAIKSSYSTTRIEEDKIIVKKGVKKGCFTGKTFTAIIENNAQKSSDYGEGVILPRPSHADYVASVKYGKAFDYRGGGKFSGRLTAPICIVGSIAKELLEKNGIKINAFVSSVGNVKLKSYDDINLETFDFNFKNDKFQILDENEREKVEREIISVREEKDSVGGTIDCVITGVPVGVGEYMFDSLEGVISRLAFAVPAVKGIEFGKGFDLAKEKGSIANDCFYYDNGKVKTYTNNNGGINGGIANGMPITFRVVIKPTPSIGKEQKTINLKTGENDILAIKGRHDACIVPRAVAVIEAISAIAIYDNL